MSAAVFSKSPNLVLAVVIEMVWKNKCSMQETEKWLSNLKQKNKKKEGEKETSGWGQREYEKGT